MDSSFARNLSVGPIIWFAVFGFLSATAAGCGIVGALIYFAVCHVRFI
jgi:hypothetical protein